ncbi:MAG: glutamyl-tRNA reductase [Methanobrevibacter sp.]|nr:glutamyl-tRNA reductase [Methanobrevibacter sp.]
MIINIRVDHTIADIETMEHVSIELKDLFNELKEEFNIQEYIEITTCNRKEYFIHNDSCSYDHNLLDHENKSLIIDWGDTAIVHLLKMTSGLESMIIGEDQILGQIKTSKKIAEKEGHCGKVLSTLFTKAIHVGQVVRNKTKINRGSVSIGSAAVDLAEKHVGDLNNKDVLVIGAGKMGTLVAKALAEKKLKAILVANRTYYKAVRLANELKGKAILLDELNSCLSNADVVISATGSPHLILTKDRIEGIINKDPSKKMMMIDIANPRDIDENVKELGIHLFNIDDLRGIADENKKFREKEAKQAEEIISYEFDLLKNSFKLMEVEGLMADIKLAMEDIRQKESQKAIAKLVDIQNSAKVIDNLSKSIVNKIFHDISLNIKKAAEKEDFEVIEAMKYIFQK